MHKAILSINRTSSNKVWIQILDAGNRAKVLAFEMTPRIFGELLLRLGTREAHVRHSSFSTDGDFMNLRFSYAWGTNRVWLEVYKTDNLVLRLEMNLHELAIIVTGMAEVVVLAPYSDLTEKINA